MLCWRGNKGEFLVRDGWNNSYELVRRVYYGGILSERHEDYEDGLQADERQSKFGDVRSSKMYIMDL